jgi:hypothetical protein
LGVIQLSYLSDATVRGKDSANSRSAAPELGHHRYQVHYQFSALIDPSFLTTILTSSSVFRRGPMALLTLDAHDPH